MECTHDKSILSVSVFEISKNVKLAGEATE